jgi:hypothetical protein
MSEQNLLLSECGYPHTSARPLNDSIAGLIAMIPGEDREMKSVADRIAELEQQLADAQKDSARYHWVQDWIHGNAVSTRQFMLAKTRAEYDSAIDDAITKESK